MKPESQLHICPVCLMQVDTPDIEARYLDVEYWNCSEQCKARFIANPGLYVGRPGEKSPKQEGKQVLKKRKIYLDEPVSSETRTKLLLMLFKMMGVKRIQQFSNSLVIEYDLLEVTAKQIAEWLLSAGLQLEDSQLQQIWLSLIDITEESEIASLEVPQNVANASSCH